MQIKKGTITLYGLIYAKKKMASSASPFRLKDGELLQVYFSDMSFKI